MRRIVNLLSCVDGPRKNKTKIKISMRKKIVFYGVLSSYHRAELRAAERMRG